MQKTILTTVLASLMVGTTCFGASVELSVVQSSRASFGAAQKWASALATLRNIRVRSNSSQAPRPAAKWVGSTLYLTAVIGANDELVLPDRKFTVRQTKALSAWIDAQKLARANQGKEANDQKFGLTVSELERVHELLKTVVTQSTKEMSPRDAIRKIVRSHSLPLRMASKVQTSLGDTKIATEWKGFSAGTVLAALLRSQEQVLVPRISLGRIQLHVESEKTAKEGWPVGWPPKLKKHELVPKLFETLPIEIYDTSVSDVMKALEGRIETPIIFDEALLSAAKLDPASTKVTIKAQKSFYGKVIRKAAFDAKMKSEVRIDDRGKPFFWIVPAIKRSR